MNMKIKNQNCQFWEKVLDSDLKDMNSKILCFNENWFKNFFFKESKLCQNSSPNQFHLFGLTTPKLKCITFCSFWKTKKKVNTKNTGNFCSLNRKMYPHFFHSRSFLFKQEKAQKTILHADSSWKIQILHKFFVLWFFFSKHTKEKLSGPKAWLRWKDLGRNPRIESFVFKTWSESKAFEPKLGFEVLYPWQSEAYKLCFQTKFVKRISYSFNLF
jgi:hypothetical protein